MWRVPDPGTPPHRRNGRSPPPSRRRRAGQPLVVADLLPKVLVLALEQVHLLLDAYRVVLQQLTTLVDGVLTLAGQLRVAAHLRDRHPGVAQATEQLQPAEVVVGEDPLPARRPVHVGEQADLLVV